MNLSDAPSKVVLPFANNGSKNSIPVASQIPITPGAASWYDGFPPLTRTEKSAGGFPPFGLDANGILFSISALTRWANAGAGYVYDNTFVTDTNINGYPKGARILRTDGTGYWLNTIDGNIVDPESASSGVAYAAGWVPDFTNGITSVTMTNANVTLTPAQYGKPVIVLTGLLTGNLNLIFPAIQGKWYVLNNTTGAFTITCKTNSGTGFVVSTLGELIGDGTNIYNANKDSALLTVANVFTQIQSAATPSQFDNSTKLATTAFVQRALGSSSAVTSVGSNTTLTAASAGATISINSGTPTITLPAASAVTAGTFIYFVSYVAGATIARAGSDTLVMNSSSALTSLAINDGEDLILMSDGSTKWQAISGSSKLKYPNNFRVSLNNPGYQVFPSGLIVQWANPLTTGAGGTVTWTYPIAFPNARLFDIPGTPSGNYTIQGGATSTTTQRSFGLTNASTGAAAGSGVTFSAIIFGF